MQCPPGASSFPMSVVCLTLNTQTKYVSFINEPMQIHADISSELCSKCIFVCEYISYMDALVTVIEILIKYIAQIH